MSAYIETIEELSKSQSLRNGSADDFANMVLLKSLELLKCHRVNAWLFNENKTILKSLCSISQPSLAISIEDPLIGDQLPNYFMELKRNEVIVSNDAQSELLNEELLSGYLIPNAITSMIDVPLRSDGEMIGVICFEHVGEIHEWQVVEISFVQSVAQLLSLALETERKYKYRLELERLVDQKQMLLMEINHRVKNNLAIILSLLNLQKTKVKDDLHAQLFDDVKDKVFSMSLLHHQLTTSKSIDTIDLGRYIKSVVKNLHSSFNHEKGIDLKITTCDVNLNITRAMPIGLIANEILTNSYKYAFDKSNVFPKMYVNLSKAGENVRLEFTDNGPGFLSELNNGTGLELVQDLSEQIDANLIISSKYGTKVILEFLA